MLAARKAGHDKTISGANDEGMDELIVRLHCARGSARTKIVRMYTR